MLAALSKYRYHFAHYFLIPQVLAALSKYRYHFAHYFLIPEVLAAFVLVGLAAHNRMDAVVLPRRQHCTPVEASLSFSFIHFIIYCNNGYCSMFIK